MQTLVNRRGFLQHTAALAAAATGASLSGTLSSAAVTDDPYRGLPIGVQSYSLRNYDVQQAIRHIQGLGVHFVEFSLQHLPLDSSPEQIAQLQARLKQAELAISGHGVNEFSADHAANRRVFEFAHKLGIRNLPANPKPDSFDSLERLVEEYNIRIAIHNHGPGALYDKLDSVQQAVRNRHKLIGACVDTGHTLRSNEDPVKWIHELGARVFALHVKDVAEKQDRTRNVVLGTGHLDVVGMFKALRDIKFPADGSLALEYEANPENPIDEMKECIAVAKEAIAKVNS